MRNLLWRRAGAAGLTAALLLGTSLPALAANPASGTATTGQSLHLEITSPANGSILNLPPGDLTVSGLAQIGPLTESGNVLYVVDVSGSTNSVRNMDCNGDGSINNLDNLNSDPYIGTVLDCEIAGVIALNQSLAGSPGAEAGLVAFGSVSATADISPAAGDQLFLSPLGVDLTGNGIPDMEDVARSLQSGAITAFTPKSVSVGTHYNNALTSVRNTFASKAGETNIAYFLSDGQPTPGSFTTGAGSPLSDLATAGVTVNTFSVGTSAGGCGPATPLAVIAATTGGTCTEVTDPSDLADVLVQPATIDQVQVSLNGGAAVTASLAGTAWTADLGGLVPGANSVVATLLVSDGTTVTADITVYGNVGPSAEAGGPYTLTEGSSASLTGSGNDPNGDPLTYLWSPAAHLSSAASPNPLYHGVDDAMETLTLTVTDPHGLTGSDTADVTVLNLSPAITSLALPADPQPVGTSVTATAHFTDPGTLDTHSALIDWGDGTSSAGAVSEVGGSGSAHATHSYSAAGIYTVTVTTTDDDGGSASATSAHVVIYDPDGGFVTGGGWIQSPPGAYLPDPTASGRANFGFNAKYKNGASTPTGSTEFQFKAGDLNLHVSAYDWLVIHGPLAQVTGSGTINGGGEYRFMLTVIDGQATGGGGVDRFRMQIWEAESGVVIYDTQPGAPDTADPITELSGGSIKIHS